ncbi:MAG: hypothetical protein K6F89_00495, partial [Prevotella sp.]|nr:hypothetical protein [Prevotella sp.]
ILSKRSRYLFPDCIVILKHFAGTTNAAFVFSIQSTSTHTTNSRTDFFGELTFYRYMWSINS